jgi:hypothetical protein
MKRKHEEALLDQILEDLISLNESLSTDHEKNRERLIPSNMHSEQADLDIDPEERTEEGL